ncbi:MAG: mechanosensitive ion channel family protein [Phycisphaerales bacterium]
MLNPLPEAAAPNPVPAPVALPNPTQLVGELAAKPTETLTKWTETASAFAMEKGPGIVAAIIILGVGWMLAGWARRMVRRGLERAHVDSTLGKFFGNLTKWGILVFVVVTCLGTVGVNTTGFAAVIAASGLAIGLALQGNLGNLASGVLLLIFRPFKIGDAVVVAGQTGVVDGIDLFTTNLDTGDMRRIIIPNGAIFGGVIENQSHHARRQVTATVQVSSGADLDATKALFDDVIAKVIRTVPGTVTDPAPAVALSDLIPVPTWTLAVWVETPKFGAVRPVLLREIKLALDAAKISPAGPSMDVRIKEMPTVR